MVQASSQIQQTLSQLQHRTEVAARDLEALYESYFEALAQAGQRQLVLAAYHLCTQVYPDAFLKLSYGQREKLQQKLRQIGSQIQPQMQDRWQQAQRMSRLSPQAEGLSLIKQLFLQAEAARSGEEFESTRKRSAADRAQAEPEAEVKPQTDTETPGYRILSIQETESGAAIAPLDGLDLDSDEIAAIRESILEIHHDSAPSQHGDADDGSPELTALPRALAPSGPLEPVHLLRLHLITEKSVREVLKTVSEAANYLLQKAGVVPEIPKPLLAAAAASDGLVQTPLKTPNLLKISIKVLRGSEEDAADEEDEDEDELEAFEPQSSLEFDVPAADDRQSLVSSARNTHSGYRQERDDSDDHDDSSDRPRQTHVFQLRALPEFVVIHLRLSEIEFASPGVSTWRRQIRVKMSDLKKLGQTYQKAQRQLAIAQAEDAWRASWIEP